jgi:hypothetical protein
MLCPDKYLASYVRDTRVWLHVKRGCYIGISTAKVQLKKKSLVVSLKGVDAKMNWSVVNRQSWGSFIFNFDFVPRYHLTLDHGRFFPYFFQFTIQKSYYHSIQLKHGDTVGLQLIYYGLKGSSSSVSDAYCWIIIGKLLNSILNIFPTITGQWETQISLTRDFDTVRLPTQGMMYYGLWVRWILTTYWTYFIFLAHPIL